MSDHSVGANILAVLAFFSMHDPERHFFAKHDFWTLQAKVCIIAVIALVLAHAIRARGSAATRHLILTSALVAILALPVITLLPSWSLGRIAQTPPSRSFRIPLGPPVKVVTIFDKAGARPAKQILYMATPDELKNHPSAAVSAASGAPALITYMVGGYIAPIGVALLVAKIVSAFLIVRMALMLLGLQRLAARSTPASSKMREYLPQGVGHVRLRLGGETPMTWGWMRPVLLLPDAAKQWPEERLRAVILHECAHIARRDWLTQTLAQFLCALCCFNPLLWQLAKQMRREAELACDDAVLMSGMRPADYAAHLLDVARLLKTAKGNPAGAVAMASRSEVGSRLSAILDRNRPRGITDAPTRLDNFCVAALAMLILATSSVSIIPYRGLALPLTAEEINLVRSHAPIPPPSSQVLITSDPTIFDIDYGKPPDPPRRSITRSSDTEKNGLHTFFVEIPSQEITARGDYRLVAIGKNGLEMPIKFGSGKIPSSHISFLARNKFSLFLFIVRKKDLPLKDLQELRFETRAPDSDAQSGILPLVDTGLTHGNP